MIRKNNKGSTIVLVLVTFAIIGTLAILALWLSLRNYQMKVTDSKVKDNFYSAEQVLDQICAGLQTDVSASYASAYDLSMPQYMTYVKAEDETGWNTYFGSVYVKALRSRLGSKDAEGKLVSDMRYNTSLLRSYVDFNTTDSSVLPYAKIEAITAAEGEDDGLMETNSDGIVLKGVKVTFTDEKGFTSIIQTDICLAIPNMAFEKEGETPDTFAFCMIGNEGIEMKQTGLTTISGNVYAGSPNVLDSTNEDTQSIFVDTISQIELDNISYLLAEGDVNIGKENITGNAKLTLSENCQLWTDNINVRAGEANLYGISYVGDDLTLSGRNPKVVLGKEQGGAYFGYGNSTEDAAKSSAIIVNGKNSVLDMSELEEITVAGYSYIATANSDKVEPGKLNNVTQVNKNVPLGESIALKGDQIAYLAPVEWIGTESDGSAAISKFRRNPITVAEYKEIMEDEDAIEVNPYTSGASVGGKRLVDYIGMSEAGNASQYIYKVFVRSKTSNENDGLVYYYVNLPQNEAENYFKDYYNQDSKRGEDSNLSAYANFYSDGVIISDEDSSVYTAGAYATFDPDKIKMTVEGGKSDNIESKLNECTKNYQLLTSILKIGNATDKQLASPVFDNVIDYSTGGAFMTATAAGTKIYTYNEADAEGGVSKTYKAIVINNASGVPYQYQHNVENQDVHLIVASGDVRVSEDFVGTIIARGKITVDRAVNITTTDANFGVNDMKNLLKYATDSDAEDALHAYEVFINGKSYFQGLTFSETGTDSDLTYSDLIYYQNWIKL